MSANGATPADAAAIEAATASEAEFIDQIRLMNGIELRLKMVPPYVIGDAARRVPVPEVPMAHIESKGIDEPNPNDPAYIEAMIQYQMDTAEAGLNVALVMGTEILSVPEGMYMPEADEWIAELEEAFQVIDGFGDITLRREPEAARKLDWLRYYAIPNEDDVVRLTTILTSTTAITEEEVAAAVAAFRRRKRRISDLGNTAFGGRADGDHRTPLLAGSDQPVGAEGGSPVQPDPVD